MDFKFGKELIKALYKIRDAINEEGNNNNNDENDENINYDEIFIKLARACNVNGAIQGFQNLKKIVISSEDIEQNNYTLVKQPNQEYVDANTKLGEIDYTLEDFLTEEQFNILKSYVRCFDGLKFMSSYGLDEDHREPNMISGYPDVISIFGDDWQTLIIGYSYINMWIPQNSSYVTSYLKLYIGSEYNKDRKICKLEFFG